MAGYQDQYDQAMLEFSKGDYDAAILKLEEILQQDPEYFDARLSLGMAYCRKGDIDRAIEEGHKAEKLRPNEQLVHTNLSLFYVKKGDKPTAEHHGLQARIAGWKKDLDAPSPKESQARETEDDLSMAQSKPKNIKVSGKLPEMPWKKKANSGHPQPRPNDEKSSDHDPSGSSA